MRVIIFPLVFVIAGVLLYIAYTEFRGISPIKDYRERKVYRWQKAAYLRRNPDHSLSEPIVWHCACTHTDFVHTNDKGCKDCNCELKPVEVRDRY